MASAARRASYRAERLNLPPDWLFARSHRGGARNVYLAIVRTLAIKLHAFGLHREPYSARPAYAPLRKRYPTRPDPRDTARPVAAAVRSRPRSRSSNDLRGELPNCERAAARLTCDAAAEHADAAALDGSKVLGHDRRHRAYIGEIEKRQQPGFAVRHRHQRDRIARCDPKPRRRDFQSLGVVACARTIERCRVVKLRA